jgi:hypothetical protein
MCSREDDPSQHDDAEIEVAANAELPPTVERVSYSAWYHATCTTPGAIINDWAGFSGSREDTVVVEAVAHVLDTGHETAVERTSSVHYRAALAGADR